MSTVWLQYALAGAPLFALIKGIIVFCGTVIVSWLTILVYERIPFALRLIFSRSHRAAAEYASHDSFVYASARLIASAMTASPASVAAGHMGAQHAAAALGQHAKIAARLRRFDHAEARLAARYCEIGIRRGRDR